jgi:hypothetical protein
MRYVRAPILSVLSLALLAPAFGRQEKPEGEPEVVPVSQKKTRVHLGPVHVGAGWTHSRGHFFHPWSPWYRLYHRPFLLPAAHYLYDPYLYPFPSSREGTGEVRLENIAEDAAVFVNGGYAGLAGDLRKFRLHPGAYTLRIEADGKEPFETRLYVLTGKTLRVRPGDREGKP